MEGVGGRDREGAERRTGSKGWKEWVGRSRWNGWEKWEERVGEGVGRRGGMKEWEEGSGR